MSDYFIFTAGLWLFLVETPFDFENHFNQNSIQICFGQLRCAPLGIKNFIEFSSINFFNKRISLFLTLKILLIIHLNYAKLRRKRLGTET